MYSHRSSTGPVDLAFTDRYGGVSAGPFDSLNLALVGDDDPAATARNVELVLADFAPGARLADMEQVHRENGRTEYDKPLDLAKAIDTTFVAKAIKTLGKR